MILNLFSTNSRYLFVSHRLSLLLESPNWPFTTCWWSLEGAARAHHKSVYRPFSSELPLSKNPSGEVVVVTFLSPIELHISVEGLCLPDLSLSAVRHSVVSNTEVRIQSNSPLRTI